jgi:hypothetical protein
MLENTSCRKASARRRIWRWGGVALALLLALLVLGISRGGDVFAHASGPLHVETVAPQTADAAPAVVPFFNGTSYVGWTGMNPAHNLNLMTYNSATKVFGPAIVLTDTTVVGSGPSLTVFNGNLYVGWRGADNRLNVARYDPSDPSHLAGKVTLSQYSYNAPSIAAFNGRLYLSWRGLDGRLNIISSADSQTFNTMATYSLAIRTSPTLVATPFFLEIAWEEPGVVTVTLPYVVIAQYDTSHPATLSVVISTTATSVLPVSLDFAGVAGYPALVIAWCPSGSTQISLGFFGGSPVITGIVQTGQFTNYGPALSRPLLGWTGTDTYHHVNVSSESL